MNQDGHSLIIEAYENMHFYVAVIGIVCCILCGLP